MKAPKDIGWFKKEIEPQLVGYEVSYRYFEQGDFGSLNQIWFDRQDKGGQIDFWGLGWLGIYLWDYIDEVEVINILLSSDEIEKGDEWLDTLVRFLTTS
jgi:hypothetical protein